MDARMRWPQRNRRNRGTTSAAIPVPVPDAVWRARAHRLRARRRLLAATASLALVMLLGHRRDAWPPRPGAGVGGVRRAGRDAVLHRTGSTVPYSWTVAPTPAH
ncbi:hypothetical protein QJS66_03760 [Kocuria rhizophila]|nr:hypothetical protein QJS66_03760 [Kocuria rhizophila]